MWEIFKFELQYRSKRPATYLYFFIMFLLAFCAITTDVVQVGGSSGQVKVNAPTTIATFYIILSAIPGLLLASAIMGVPVLRDFQHHTASMIFTTPIKKWQYLGGRFLGSLVVTLFVFSGMFVGLSTGLLMPWLEAEEMLPYNFYHLVHPFLIFVVPNVLIMAGIFFASGALSKKIMVVYAQGIFLFVAYQLGLLLTRDLDNQTMAALLDPFGISTVRYYTQYWTIMEKNTEVVPLVGVILQNRILWTLVSLAALVLTYFGFNFNVVKNAKKRLKKVKNQIVSAPNTANTLTEIPTVQQDYSLANNIKQLFSLSWFYFRWIWKQATFRSIIIAGLLVTVTGVIIGRDRTYDVFTYLNTFSIIELLQQFNLFFIIIIVVYSGELIWKERDIKMNLIYDAMPYPNFVNVGGKFLSMVWALMSLLFILMITGIVLQLIFGQSDIQVGLYVSKLFGELLIGMILFVFLAFFIQTLVNHKFLGHALFVVFFIATLVLSELGFEHSMFQYGNADLGTYSEMNSFGHYVPTFSWFTIYWLGLAMLLYAVVLYFTVRGVDTKFMTRFKIGNLRLSRPLITFGLASLLVFIASGCFVYYNTNVVNEYSNSDQREKEQADYEKTLKKYEFLPQLKIIDTYVEVDIRPEERDFTARGKYILKNKTDQPIQDIHVQLSADQELTTTVEFGVTNEVKEAYDEFKYTVYRLSQPVAPNDSIEMNFVADFKTEGFRESGSNTEVLHNGTFFNNQYFPSFGYSNRFELQADDDRREQGLAEKERMMERNDPIGKKINLLTDDSDRMNFEAIISTAPDQIAIAPGYLQREWEENGRKYYHYKMDEPILGFYSIVSARYEVLRDEWVSKDGSQKVNLEIYYHDGHGYNLDRMVKGMKKSLDYFTTNFSPYQYRQLRIMEFPRYRSFAQSFPNTVPFSEEIGFILKIEEDDVDIPFYVTAHEIGHQWWAHQVTEAQVKGNAMSSETMSQYSALMVMKKEYPPEMMQQFLKLELDRYLRGRNRETKKEQPLTLVEGQGYIHYRKGSLVMYALQDYISEDSVNLALRRIIDNWAYREDEYITSDEYVKEFRKVTPDSLQYIITDMFETITLYENRTKSATYATKNNQYEVTLDVNALKYRADSLGNETKIPIRDWIDVGVYTRGKTGQDSLVYLQKHLIDQEEMQIKVMVDAVPTKAGIDPINKLVDRNSGDNRVGVEELE